MIGFLDFSILIVVAFKVLKKDMSKLIECFLYLVNVIFFK